MKVTINSNSYSNNASQGIGHRWSMFHNCLHRNSVSYSVRLRVNRPQSTFILLLRWEKPWWDCLHSFWPSFHDTIDEAAGGGIAEARYVFQVRQLVLSVVPSVDNNDSFEHSRLAKMRLKNYDVGTGSGDGPLRKTCSNFEQLHPFRLTPCVSPKRLFLRPTPALHCAIIWERYSMMRSLLRCSQTGGNLPLSLGDSRLLLSCSSPSVSPTGMQPKLCVPGLIGSTCSALN